MPHLLWHRHRREPGVGRSGLYQLARPADRRLPAPQRTAGVGLRGVRGKGADTMPRTGGTMPNAAQMIDALRRAEAAAPRLSADDLRRLSDLQRQLERGEPAGLADRRWLEELCRKHLGEDDGGG